MARKSAASKSLSRHWSLEELVTSFSRFNLIARSRDAGSAALPEGLVPAITAPERSWAEQISAMHPDDRAVSVRAWWSAQAQPGKVFQTEVRYLVDDLWQMSRNRYLSLLHQPEFSIVLVAIEQLAGTELPPGPATDSAIGAATWNATHWIVQYLDSLGAIARTDGHVVEIFGRPAAELVGKTVLDFLHPDDHGPALEMWLELMKNPGEARTIRQRIVRPDKSVKWIESTVTNRLQESPPIGGMVVGVSHDITIRLEEEQALRASQEEFRSLAEEMPVAVFRATARGKITYANAHWYRLVAGVPGPIARLSDLVMTEDQPLVKSALLEALQSSSLGQARVEFRGRDGKSRFGLKVRVAGAGSGVKSLLGVLEDISATVALRHLADHDSLTGLLNREGLDRQLTGLLETGGAIVAFVDLDAFKQINDTHGHQVGDGVLVELGQRLAAIGELVSGRWGGDEFVILAPAGKGLAAAARKLQAKIEQVLSVPVDVNGESWTPSASIGIAVGGAGDSPSNLLRLADQAMYAIKRQRRGLP